MTSLPFASSEVEKRVSRLRSTRTELLWMGGQMTGDSGSFDVEGNRLTLLIEPQDRLTGLLALIEGAQTSLRLLYYTFADDTAGRRGWGESHGAH